MNSDERGLIITDRTDVKKLKIILRKMRRFNPIPNKRDIYSNGSRNITIDYIIEDPVFRDSKDSFFHQIVDVVCYCARQLYEPNLAFKKKGGQKFYERLKNVITYKASKKHPLGIVEL